MAGVQRLRGRLDHRLGQSLDRGIESVPAPLLDTLRIGAYELSEVRSSPDYAAVDQAVRLARSVGGRRGAGLVNAVLRRVAGEGWGPEYFPDPERDPLGHLSTWGSHPRWLVGRWLDRFGLEETTRLVEHDNQVPDLFVRSPDGVRALAGRLESDGVTFDETCAWTGCVKLEGDFDLGEGLERWNAFVQDPGAALVTAYADPDEGALVVDLCAAPGGKAIALRGGGARVFAADSNPARMRDARASLAARGIPAVVARAQAPPFRDADMVLVDAPCTGTGTLRRHPDARWRVDADALGALTRIQDAVLRGAARAVRPGGLLVYSTCSIEPEENMERVDRFLEDHPGYTLESVGAREGRDSLRSLVDASGALEVLPQRTGFDGAFAARLWRRPPTVLGTGEP